MTIGYLCTFLLAWGATCATASSDHTTASNYVQLRGSSTQQRRLQPPAVGPVIFAKRINIAGPTYTDSNGNVWEADTVTDGKNAAILCNRTTDTIGRTVDDPLYCTYKWYATANSAVPFRREISVDQAKGVYQVRLHFAELVSGFAALMCWACVWTMLNLSCS